MVEPLAVSLLEALHEPAMLVDRDGILVSINRAAGRIVGGGAVGRPLADFLAKDDGRLEKFLARCLGSGDSMPGTLDLAAEGDAQKMLCRGSRLACDDGVLVLLRLSASGEARFAALTQTVSDLKEELKLRRRSEAMLEESVAERELLLRELEHRVKNNMQMLSALLGGAEREAASAEAKAALKEASQRFAAVSAVQQLLYRSSDLRTIGSQALVSTLTKAVSTLSQEPIDTEESIEAIDLPIESAVSIGLILNELLTNAVKYGRPGEGVQTIGVEFTRKGGKIELAVHDNGPGFDLAETGKRASGLGLVRGLLRQLGGSIRVERVDGSRCIVAFPAPETPR